MAPRMTNKSSVVNQTFHDRNQSGLARFQPKPAARVNTQFARRRSRNFLY